MDKTRRTDDELLSAYIDGELQGDDAEALVTRLGNEPRLAERLEAMRRGDDAVREIYEKLDQVPLPESVTRLLDIEDEDDPGGNVVALRRLGTPRFASFPVAIAASIALVAGFIALRLVGVDPGGEAADALVAGNLDTGGAVHELLETGVSGRPEELGDTAEMGIVLSFEGDSGAYCRQLYVAVTERTVHGVACRHTTGWQLEAVAVGAPAPPGGSFQAAAATMPEAVSSAVDSLIGAREPLSREEEIGLISRGWKRSSD